MRRAETFHAIVRSAALAVTAAAGIFLLGRPPLRVQLDATKTRAYALSEQTLHLLGSLEGDWQVAVVAAENSTDDATRRQVDEVLRRFAEANPRLRTLRIDPTDPRSFGEWERLVASLERSSGPHAAAFRAKLDEAQAEFAAFVDFAQTRAGLLRTLPPSGSEEVDRALGGIAAGFSQLVEGSDAFLAELARLRSTTPERPLADDEAARAALVASHGYWSEQLASASTLTERWASMASLAPQVRSHLREAGPAFEAMAQRLRNAEDGLARLPALESAEIGRQIAAGEVAVVTGPPGAAVVPAWQLFPALTREAPGPLRFDRRFRGEQVLAAAIRSLLRTPPMVVLVHGEERSLLRANEERRDLVAAADVLRAARCDVREWLPTDAVAPAPRPGQPVVWVIVPPQSRQGIETSASERLLLERALRLVEQGEPVLLTVARSLRPLFRQEDPWSRVTAAFDLAVRSGEVIFELDPVAPARGLTRSWQRVEAFDAAHPIGRALAGQALVLTHPTPVRCGEAADCAVLASIAPDEARWLETDWRVEGRERSAPPKGRGFDAPAPVVVAAERRLPESGRRQRVLVVGSGGWLLSSVMDAAESLGGGRLVLSNPGNRELMLSGVAWLAGMDDLIAPGPTGRETARLAGIDGQTRLLWATIAVGVLPLGTLALGAAVLAARRRP